MRYEEVACIGCDARGIVRARRAHRVIGIGRHVLISGMVSRWYRHHHHAVSGLESGEAGLLLEETVLGIKIDVVCSGVFDGSIGPNGADDITELLELTTGTRITNELVETSGILCTNTTNCPEPLVWAFGLPWLTLTELMVDGTEEFFVDLLTSTVAGQAIGYHIVCMGSGLSDLCTTTEAVAKLTNEANGTVDGEFSEPFTELAGLKLANCEMAGNEKGIVEGLGFILLTGGGSLAVSE